jgi:hypothetical protein
VLFDRDLFMRDRQCSSSAMIDDLAILCLGSLQKWYQTQCIIELSHLIRSETNRVNASLRMLNGVLAHHDPT